MHRHQIMYEAHALLTNLNGVAFKRLRRIQLRWAMQHGL